MKNYLTITALAATAALVSLSAQAQTAPMTRAQATDAPASAAVQSQTPKAQSGLTRAEVRAELARARAAGEMDFAAAEVNGGSPYAPRQVAAPVYARKGGDSRVR